MAQDAQPSAAPSPRLVSVDALRGFDMFWIVGAEHIVHALNQAHQGGAAGFLSGQLQHAAWAGFTFYDLIFPLFVFIVGISIVLSMGKAREKYGVAGALRRIAVRTCLIFIAGLIFNAGLRDGWERVRFAGVLQRIAICYAVGATLYLLVRPRIIAAVAGAILLGYWALFTWVPVRDISLEKEALAAAQSAAGGADAHQLFEATTTWVRGGTEPGKNLANHLDFQYLPGRKYNGAYDPEGILSTLPSIVTCLLGLFAGLLLKRKELSEQQKVYRLLAGGAIAVAVGLLWGLWFPIIKQLWTSSYVLVSAGLSAVLLAGFHQIIEVWQRRRWALPFLWIGMNAITIYLGRRFIDFRWLAEALVGGPVKASFGVYGEMLVTTVMLALVFLFLRFLYQRKIFLRL
jgi:predicted acyltransferase